MHRLSIIDGANRKGLLETRRGVLLGLGCCEVFIVDPFFTRGCLIDSSMKLTPDLTDAIKRSLHIDTLPPRWDDEQGFALKQRLAAADPALLEELEVALLSLEDEAMITSEGRVAQTRAGVDDVVRSLYASKDAFSGEWVPNRAKIGAWIAGVVLVPVVLLVGSSLGRTPVTPEAAKPPAQEAQADPPEAATAPTTDPAPLDPNVSSASVGDAAGVDSSVPSVASQPTEPLQPRAFDDASPSVTTAPAQVAPRSNWDAPTSSPSRVSVAQRPTLGQRPNVPPRVATPAPQSRPIWGAPTNPGAVSPRVSPGSSAVTFQPQATNGAPRVDSPNPSSVTFDGDANNDPAPRAPTPASEPARGEAVQGEANAGSSSSVYQGGEKPAETAQSSSMFSSSNKDAPASPPGSAGGSSVYGGAKPVTVGSGKPETSSSSLVSIPASTPSAPTTTPNTSSAAMNTPSSAMPLKAQTRYNPGDVVSAAVLAAVEVPANSVVPIIWRDADSSEWYGTAKLSGSRVMIEVKTVLFDGVAYAVKGRVVSSDGSNGVVVPIAQRSPAQAEQAVENGFSSLRGTLGEVVGDPTKGLPGELGGLAWAFADGVFGFLGAGTKVTIPTGVVKEGLPGSIVVL
jgi:Conjugative transposon, TraM